jgi:hypothetical protein
MGTKNNKNIHCGILNLSSNNFRKLRILKVSVGSKDSPKEKKYHSYYERLYLLCAFF